MSYWIYQFIGNLSPRELEGNALYRTGSSARGGRPRAAGVRREGRPRAGGQAVELLPRPRLDPADRDGFADRRVLEEGHRSIFDEDEWDWIRNKARGDFDHLLIGTSDPYLLAPGLHDLEAWNEAVCNGAWGGVAAGLGERLRRALDCDHWSAFSARSCDSPPCWRRSARASAAVHRPRSASSPATSITPTSPRWRSAATRT